MELTKFVGIEIKINDDNTVVCYKKYANGSVTQISLESASQTLKELLRLEEEKILSKIATECKNFLEG